MNRLLFWENLIVIIINLILKLGKINEINLFYLTSYQKIFS